MACRRIGDDRHRFYQSVNQENRTIPYYTIRIYNTSYRLVCFLCTELSFLINYSQQLQSAIFTTFWIHITVYFILLSFFGGRLLIYSHVVGFCTESHQPLNFLSTSNILNENTLKWLNISYFIILYLNFIAYWYFVCSSVCVLLQTRFCVGQTYIQRSWQSKRIRIVFKIVFSPFILKKKTNK